MSEASVSSVASVTVQSGSYSAPAASAAAATSGRPLTPPTGASDPSVAAGQGLSQTSSSYQLFEMLTTAPGDEFMKLALALLQLALLRGGDKKNKRDELLGMAGLMLLAQAGQQMTYVQSLRATTVQAASMPSSGAAITAYTTTSVTTPSMSVVA